MRAVVPAAILLVGIVAVSLSPGARSAGNGNGNGSARRNYYRFSGSVDWQFFRTESVSAEVPSTYDSFRQQYSVDLVGSIWDFRFNRFALGLDLYFDDRSINGQEADWNGIGYRANTTFFPNRPFPLRMFARRMSVDAAGVALADSDRETEAWGVEWNIATRRQQNARIQYDNSSYDLLAPVALRERNEIGTVELSQRWRRRQTSLRYGYTDRSEQVRDTQFVRQDVHLSDRTRFDNGMTLLLNANHVLSDARFSTGVTDDLTQSRVTTRFDIPRRQRVGFAIGYDYNDTDGRFLRSTSHYANADLRVAIAEHWEAILGGTLGRVTTRTDPATEILQDTLGTRAGLRYNRGWSRLFLTAAYSFGVVRTEFDVEPERTVTNHAADLNLRVPFGESASWFGSATVRQDENDVTGLGYTFDEVLARSGIEGDLGGNLRAEVSAYGRDSVYETFQFGVQESREVGLQGTLSGDRGSVSLTAAKRDGISEFIPDPGGGSPGVPGPDLVRRADIFTAGAHVRFGRRMSFRVQVRYEDREYTSIGQESILVYNPEVEWRPGAWKITAGLSHYERTNSLNFDQDTIRLKLGRRFF